MKIFDMLLANAMMGESGGGGGDLSTAEVILTINGKGVDVWGAILYEDPESPSYTGSYTWLDSSTNIVILYKGKAFLVATEPLTDREVSVTGDIIFDSVSDFTVTGNGTITIS